MDINSLAPGGTIWHHATWPTLVQVTYCFMASITWTNVDLSCGIDLRATSQEVLKIPNPLIRLKITHLTQCGLMTPYGDMDLGQHWLTAQSHYLNQFWLIIRKVRWYSSEDNFTSDISAISHWNKLENYLYKIPLKSPRGQWVKSSGAETTIFQDNVVNILATDALDPWVAKISTTTWYWLCRIYGFVLSLLPGVNELTSWCSDSLGTSN